MMIVAVARRFQLRRRRASSPRASRRSTAMSSSSKNRTGASGNIGQASVAKAAPDGYTFIVTTPGPAGQQR
ncbi:MAG: hypothetical protein IPO58_26640 [Betaproteobacteria bacterium]|nr:hypothetical protein [Betaproteobacteria bacterium]